MHGQGSYSSPAVADHCCSCFFWGVVEELFLIFTIYFETTQDCSCILNIWSPAQKNTCRDSQELPMQHRRDSDA